MWLGRVCGLVEVYVSGKKEGNVPIIWTPVFMYMGRNA